MDAWPRSTGEAIHTSTFLGHPVGCAAALASMSVLRDERLMERSAALGARMMGRLIDIAAGHPNVGEVRGRGMLIGMEMVRDRGTREPAPELAGRLVVEGLRRGVLLLGGGIHGSVLSLSPPFVADGRAGGPRAGRDRRNPGRDAIKTAQRIFWPDPPKLSF